ncbi:phosphoribosyltransferase family protein [Nostoc sp. FACHB-190]|uniref:phosphoribosyltransferase family protein n=1 Tax=Nostoc sp. FACHB-190 TaxID=2692838 RepID=UPI001686F82F|nr:phosphoribosyltransferase family protein [Nostoc sp. FACHB-190]MBD2302822.1 phosphoribosyl transferase [Nostoc sp. FACHB-190]
MYKNLKGVIFSIDGVIATGVESNAVINNSLIFELGRLINYLLTNGLQPVVMANRDWTIGNQRLEDFVSNLWGNFPWYIANRGDMPYKPSREAINYVLEKMGWDDNETIYLGNSIDDMRTAVNGGILLLNTTWYCKNISYGFEFDSPHDVARFIDIFCLRKHFWHYSINQKGLEYYSLGPYSTYKPEFAIYSEDAKNTVKFGAGHPDFWTKYLLSTIYFSGLHKRIDLVAPYPGHKQGSTFNVIEEPMVIFTKCFNKAYLRDLVIRHTQSTKSAFARSSGQQVDHLNQLNTIRLNQYPFNPRGAGDKPYKNCPVKKGKTVLIVDDICTKGYSLEAARIYIEQTGAKVISLSWLKTINTDYAQIQDFSKFNPFQVNRFLAVDSVTRHPYKKYVLDPFAPEEIDSRLSEYDNWQWPTGI